MLSRLTVVKLFFLFAFALVGFRLFLIMFVEHEIYAEKAKIQQVKREEIIPKRGHIYDRQGREIAISVERDSLYVDPVMLKRDENFEKLKKLINFKEEDLSPYIHSGENERGGKSVDRAKRFVWISRKMDDSLAEQVRALKVRGVGIVTEHMRYYPKAHLASHVVGFVDVDERGIEGLEKFYDSYLRAERGSKVVLRDGTGRKLSDGKFVEIKGNDVYLTIDEGLQYIVEKHLDEATRKWRASSATAIMMEPYTGEILALANRPTFNPNKPKAAKNLDSLRNRAITDLYEPGSTFKIVAASAALEEKLVKTSTKFDCSLGFIEVGGKRIKDVHRNGVLTFEEVIQKSSNVGTIKIAMMLGKERLYQYIKKFGFGQKTEIDLPGEVSGYVRPPERWSGTSIGAIPIGQEVAVTALQVLRAYAVIANGGYLVKPYVVSEIRSPDGNTLYRAVIKRERILSEQTATTMREILKKVTEQGGTAVTAKVDGNNVAGKTGTAQKYDPKQRRYSKDKFVSSFVGFIPAEDPKIALIVVVHDPVGGHYGGTVAAPVFRAIANEALAYLNVPRDDSKDKGLLVTLNHRGPLQRQ